MADIPVAVADRVAAGADAIKIVLTGIIDFSRAAVRGAPQFTARELELLVACAHDAGLPTLAHCSGAAGIDLALAAGVDSIEHGFIMRPDQVDALAANDATWVPTFTPVAFQRDEPDWVGWEPDAVDGQQRMLADHTATLRRALVAGVRLLVGSDACSHGVPHGAGLLRECRLMQAAGCDLAQVLTAVTSAPRQAWGLPGGHIAIGQPADLALFDATATAGVDALAHPHGVWIAGHQLVDRHALRS